MSPKLLKRVEKFSDTVDEEEGEDQTLKMVLIVLGIVALIAILFMLVR